VRFFDEFINWLEFVVAFNVDNKLFASICPGKILEANEDRGERVCIDDEIFGIFFAKLFILGSEGSGIILDVIGAPPIDKGRLGAG
jgi:hypothetical protein